MKDEEEEKKKNWCNLTSIRRSHRINRQCDRSQIALKSNPCCRCGSNDSIDAQWETGRRYSIYRKIVLPSIAQILHFFVLKAFSLDHPLPPARVYLFFVQLTLFNIEGPYGPLQINWLRTQNWSTLGTFNVIQLCMFSEKITPFPWSGEKLCRVCQRRVAKIL